MSDSTARSKKGKSLSTKGTASSGDLLSLDNNDQQRETETEEFVDGSLADLVPDEEKDRPDEGSSQTNAVVAYASPVSTDAGQPPPTGHAITVQIDARKIPSQRQTGNMTALDTLNLAKDYSDEQILLGLVAHPHDLHGTLFLRLAENYSNEELARRINELYDALETKKPKNNTYSKRFTGALKEEKVRHGWSDADYEREKERIKSRRKVQRPREWIYMPSILSSGKQASPSEGQAQDHREADHQDMMGATRSGSEEKTVQAQTADDPQASSSIEEDTAEEDDVPSDEPVRSDVVEDSNKTTKLTVQELAKQPSRKWTRKLLKFKSFTGSEWSVPTFTAAVTDQGQRRKAQLASGKKKSTREDVPASTTDLKGKRAPCPALAAVDTDEVAPATEMKEDEEDAVVDGVGDDGYLNQNEVDAEKTM